jgi:hypothetical protein
MTKPKVGGRSPSSEGHIQFGIVGARHSADHHGNHPIALIRMPRPVRMPIGVAWGWAWHSANHPCHGPRNLARMPRPYSPAIAFIPMPHPVRHCRGAAFGRPSLPLPDRPHPNATPMMITLKRALKQNFKNSQDWLVL